MKTKNLIFPFFFCLLSLAVWAFYLHFEEVISYKNPMLDGYYYLQLYDFFQGTITEISVIAPFNTRIGYIYLASLLPVQDPIDAFMLINIVFTLLSIYMLYVLWKELNISTGVMAVGYIWLIFHWIGIVRHNHSDPVSVDIPLYLMLAAWYWALLKKERLYLLPLLAVVGTLQKESMLAICLATLAGGYLMHRLQRESFNFPEIKKMLIISCVLALITELTVKHYFPPVGYTYKDNSVIVLLRNAYMYIKFPFKTFRVILSLFFAYGAFWLLYLRPERLKILAKDPVIFLAAVSIFLGLFGGLDHTRILFLGFPFVATIMMRHANLLSRTEQITALVLSLPLLRIHEIMENSGGYSRKNWFPEKTLNANFLWISGGYFLFTVAVLLLIQFYESRKNLSIDLESKTE